MDAYTIAIATGLIGLIYLIASSVLQYRKLTGFNGPVTAGLSSLWLFYQSAAGRLPQKVAEALDKHGVRARL